jgi:hypothetical protein
VEAMGLEPTILLTASQPPVSPGFVNARGVSSSFELRAPVVSDGSPSFADLRRFYGYHFGYHW